MFFLFIFKCRKNSCLQTETPGVCHNNLKQERRQRRVAHRRGI